MIGRDMCRREHVDRDIDASSPTEHECDTRQ